MLMQQIEPQLVRPPVAIGASAAGGMIERARGFGSHRGVSIETAPRAIQDVVSLAVIVCRYGSVGHAAIFDPPAAVSDRGRRTGRLPARRRGVRRGAAVD